MIHDIPTCQDLVSRIEKEAIETISKAKSLITDEVPSSKIAGKEIGDPNANPKSEHGKVSGNVNNPEAQIWGIGGKSKL